MNLNNFKQINDEFGYRVGNLVLKVVAEHLLDNVHECDTVFHHGDSAFVILLADIAHTVAVEQTAMNLLTIFSDSLAVDGHKVTITMSIGISIYPDDGKDMHSLIEHADIALYQARVKSEHTCGFLTTGRNGKTVDMRRETL